MLRQVVAIAIMLVLLGTSHAHAFLDSIADSAKEAARGVAYASAVSELVTALNGPEEVVEGVQDLNSRMERLRTGVSEVYYSSNEFKGLLEGPDWSAKHLDQNIRYTAQFIKRAKRLMIALGLAGTDVATAMNTAETNNALNEVLKNQQTQILLQKEERMASAETRLNQIKEWEAFISRERSLREKR